MNLKIQATPVFKWNWDSFTNPNIRYIINEGGARSSKTYSILQCIIVNSLKNPNTSSSIVRSSFPSLRGSIMRDFFELLHSMELYSESNHNKTEHIYTFPNGSKVEFFSTDSEQKLRGRKRDILYCNEANELTEDIFLQLKIRTTDKIIMDWNPSDDDHFLYKVCKEEDAILIKSTYKDNPFLSDALIKDLERLIEADYNYYKIYVLGERPTKTSRVYNHFKITQDDLLFNTWDDISYGLDLGFNDPCALVETKYKGDKIYVKELLYESKLTTQDLIGRLNDLIKDKSKPIYSDHRPEVVEELKRMGYNVIIAEKSIKAGIDFLKSKEIWIHQDSINLLREYKMYSWKLRKDGTISDEVVDYHNHCFIGDTIISMDNGFKKIKDVNIGDYVKTSNGLKKVLHKWNNGEKQVIKYRMETDTFNIYIICTPEHKIKTNQGWKQISKLKSGIMVFLDRNLMENYTIYIQKKDTSQREQKECMWSCGNILMEDIQRDSMYITSMETHGTIEYKTLSSLNQVNTYQTTLKKESKKTQSGLTNSSPMELSLQKSGIKVMKVENGIRNMVENVGLEGNIESSVVKNVEKNMKQDIVEFQSSAIITAKLELLEKEESWKEIVWDLTIEDNHEYFANGILVHNCMDSLRYSIYTHRNKKPDYMFYTIDI